MIAIAISLFNKKITDGLLDGCLRALKENGYKKSHINIYEVPGAFELPAKVQFLNSKTKYSCIIALGCVIKGETPHFDFISQASTNAIMDLSINSKKPIGNGIITCLNMKQAKARKKKGAEAAKAVISILSQK